MHNSNYDFVSVNSYILFCYNFIINTRYVCPIYIITECNDLKCECKEHYEYYVLVEAQLTYIVINKRRWALTLYKIKVGVSHGTN